MISGQCWDVEAGGQDQDSPCGLESNCSSDGSLYSFSLLDWTDRFFSLAPPTGGTRKKMQFNVRICDEVLLEPKHTLIRPEP